jgi:hypothetical protein
VAGSILAAVSNQEQASKSAAEREARAQVERAVTELREGSYRFASRVRGQAGINMEELIDPDGEAVGTLAEVEGDAGALALALPLDLITFETWALGQVGDKEELDLEVSTHRELWFNFGAWIGETLRLRHGGHWFFVGDDPRSWRLGFSRIMLEIAPHAFAEQLLRLGNGLARRMILEMEKLRQLHEEQRERDGGKDIDRFSPQHYIRLHTIPLGQWLVIDLATVDRLWSQAASRDLAKEVRKHGKRLGPQQEEVVERVAEAIEKAEQDKPLGGQTQDRALFEAVAQIIGLRRASVPVAMDIMERLLMPALHIGMPDKFPPLDEDDLKIVREGADLFAVFVEVVPHKFSADDEGFLGCIPRDALSTPYRDRGNLQIGQGDWVAVNPNRFKEMLLEFDSARLLEKYDEFVNYLKANPQAPRRRDDGRPLAEMVARGLADLKACVTAASKDQQALIFRLLPPPG